MKHAPRAIPLLLVVGLSACDPGTEKNPQTPAPSLSAPISLLDALPSPTPDQTLPSMPPAMAGSFLFYEDFERGTERWEISGGKGEIGWHLLKASTCGGLYTMVLGHTLNQASRFARTSSLLSLKTDIAIPPQGQFQIKYDVKGNVTPPEAAIIQAEIRPENGTWIRIAPTASARFPLVVTFKADLAPFLGQTIGLRFRGTTETTQDPQKGFYLDDIHIIRKRDS
ncbi:MAG: hypothetical protein VKN33_01075 [Candidatus Sericytochromatia bacterium]|nr:hypothetical protein [Candidatus Sericytochromatia bacterium]